MTQAPKTAPHRFSSLLVANRGEIACRIIATARRMGLRTIAVYSEADRDSLHVSLADEALLIGPPSARDSYLRIDRVIGAALASGAGAIHPGYGFLSENVEFAKACDEAGLVFIGPPVAAIEAMGSKSAAKALMASSGVPLVPGYHGSEQDIETLSRAADSCGYPVLVKASAGGGGKGMRIADSAAELPEAVAAAKREASASFGDDHVLIEKFITRPRHIEVQIFGDHHGNVVSLFERECTLQRRHQKVLEEAPSSRLDESQREAICEAARAAGRAVGYTGAGTVEFVANDDGFYFIEMNTRLQVEHPVTEMITGLDLVEWQLRVAFGEALPLGQDKIVRQGHSIEARIYAEDPQSGFLPATGTISQWRQPEPGPGLRIDSGFRVGDTITANYDPMIAKLIVSGDDREAALDRMAAALDAFQVAGVKTNIAFLRALVGRPEVRSGAMDTGFIERELADLLAPQAPIAAADLAAAASAVLAREQAEAASETASPWNRGDGWTLGATRRRRLDFEDGTETHEAVLHYARSGLELEWDGAVAPLGWTLREDGRIDVFLGDRKEAIGALWSERVVELVTPRGRRRLHWVDPLGRHEAASDPAGSFRAPMPGIVQQILAEPGARLERGAPVLVMEAMKMEHTLRAPADGQLVAINCRVGDLVEEGETLAEFEADAS
ncbi:acetyl/propionyl/methylcrotonyl-CoA carboxylase subunit alpha [Pelagibacterium lacus]|uniref:Acetyl-CoA carboxylase biotin carboxylase subunit n=1 Tax=Pelagibacterium lacus TaxID=2282655 RepID=A0A369WAV8_9HYPH|nr:acetyl-CoA carboxylase biotin carboxylase subunit [Pelagibacterium lacus]RDE10530.1 acetyl-CoA carboxylase biotin carboxylase subunit [Pelagibacterium lacus]